MYFTVKKPMKIGNRYYKPCICYNLTENLNSTVSDLVKLGKAEIFNAPVFFQNGKRLVKQAEKDKAEQPKVLPKKKDKKVKAEPEPEKVEEITEEDSIEGF